MKGIARIEPILVFYFVLISLLWACFFVVVLLFSEKRRISEDILRSFDGLPLIGVNLSIL